MEQRSTALLSPICILIIQCVSFFRMLHWGFSIYARVLRERKYRAALSLSLSLSLSLCVLFPSPLLLAHCSQSLPIRVPWSRSTAAWTVANKKTLALSNASTYIYSGRFIKYLSEQCLPFSPPLPRENHLYRY